MNITMEDRKKRREQKDSLLARATDARLDSFALDIDYTLPVEARHLQELREAITAENARKIREAAAIAGKVGRNGK